VWLLCAPSLEDVLPTIRSRCRLVALRTPSADAVAEVLINRDGIDPTMARFAARVSQGHVGRARWLARSEEARVQRRQVLEIPRQDATVPGCFTAAKNLFDATEAEADARHKDDIERETAEVKTAYGVGATGKGVAAASRGSAGALKELDKRQKLRTKRSQRDALDRALMDLMAFYRDVLAVQLSGEAPVQLVHVDVGELAARVAQGSSPEQTLRRMDAISACRTAIDENVAPQLALESMLLAIRAA
jgi:DNA polymerase-3 subunit delta'